MDNSQGLCGVSQLLRFTARGVVLAGLLLLLVALKLAFEAQGHLHQAEKALAEGDREEALWHFQWALRSYVPGLPANRRALMQIEDLAETWSAEGQAERAEETLRTLRATLYAIRSLYQPFPDVLRRTEKSLEPAASVSGDSATAPSIPASVEESISEVTRETR